MATAPLPARAPRALSQDLYEQHRIESVMTTWNGHRLIRISIQAYNSDVDVDRLLAALREAI
jgi:selenocysteine lyase/cysteine desulfurase